MAYFLRDCREHLLGCLLFDTAARRLPCRDEWIGWQYEPYHAHLQLVVRNARFLLLPWGLGQEPGLPRAGAGTSSIAAARSCRKRM